MIFQISLFISFYIFDEQFNNFFIQLSLIKIVVFPLFLVVFFSLLLFPNNILFRRNLIVESDRFFLKKEEIKFNDIKEISIKTYESYPQELIEMKIIKNDSKVYRITLIDKWIQHSFFSKNMFKRDRYLIHNTKIAQDLFQNNALLQSKLSVESKSFL
ncbi:hypothetical protein [Flammeovirga aprica]|uniref:Uncharacterized protein n=1 Tax=Flammeovirga aprica JL-4 TaxID=694437 RepID=A0A7X9P2Z4_9BACT|nr:hypothetical protein [Flammeovirga aprica]NME68606.1 hypothetical protein [Flammeovirga aprica JL-4]